MRRRSTCAPIGRSVLAAALFGSCACNGSTPPSPPSANSGIFIDVTAELGLGFEHDRAGRDDYFMPDSLAAGGAFLDFDRDGDLDVYVVDGDRGGGPEGANRLYRQDADGRFSDVSAASGAGDRGYGMGVAAGDINNDGLVDLYVTNYGPDALYLNNGDGTFTDSTERAGLGDARWGTSAGFVDYDRDGFLDLFVATYVRFNAGERALDMGGRPEYPGPDCCPGTPDLLYRNDGDGTFTDVSLESGIGAAAGKGLGVAFLDLDGDRRVDLYVANDGENNRAWIQRADGRFEDRAVALGIAVNGFGDAEASMGVVAGDLDGDSANDLFVTHLAQETNTLYFGRGPGTFVDGTTGSGLGQAGFDFTGFGATDIDFDLDGDLDLVVVNGRVLRAPERPGAALDAHWNPYAEENQMFDNDGQGRFRAAANCGALCADVEVSRGLARGDVDNDGDIDLLVTQGNGGVRLYRNTGAPGAHGLTLRVFDPGLGRDALGAEVRVAGLRRSVAPATSYLSSHDPRVHFGLGGAVSVEAVVVRWLDGDEERFGPLETGRAHTLTRGEGATP